MPSRRRGNKPIIIASGALLLAVLLLFFGTIPGFVAGSLHAIARPFWYVERRFASGVGVVGGFMHARSRLVAEHDALTKRVHELEARMADYHALAEENDALKANFGRGPDDYDLVLGYVLVKPGKTPYDTLIIDIGKRENIEVGDAVFAGERHIIGEVAAVFRDSAQIRLFSSPGGSIDVLVGEGAFALSANGLGNGSFAIEVPRDLAVVEGDAVYLPQKPPAFFGTVEAVGGAAADPFKVILFRNPVNMSELRWVMVARDLPGRFLPEEVLASTTVSNGH